MRITNVLKSGKCLALAMMLGFATTASANTLDAIALVVNDEPITVLDIQDKMDTSGKKKAEAVSELIDQILFEQELDKHNVTADVFEINDHLEKLAASNGMDLYTFKSIIKQRYKDYDAFEEQTKQQVLKQKLVQKIIRGKLAIATDEDLKIYYDNNQPLFKSANQIQALQFTSKNKQALAQAQRNPMGASAEVLKTPVTLQYKDLSGQMRYLVNETKVNQFTPIFIASKQYVTLYVQKKEGVTTLPFDSVKEKIFNVVMQNREKAYLKEYFEKLKLTADIKIVR